MNGRAARRIRRAVWPTMRSTTNSFNAVLKQLKREYKAKPYHKREGIGYVVLSHKGQERRWWDWKNYHLSLHRLPRPEPDPVEERPFYDDHSRFKYLEKR